MKFPSLLVALFLAIAAANASMIHDHNPGHIARHSSLAQRQASSLPKTRKRCVRRPVSSSSSRPPASSALTSKRPAATSPAALVKPSSTKAPQTTQKPATTPINNNSGASSGGKTVNLQGPCGNSNATPQSTKNGGPNGATKWFNCGLDSGGWNPPKLTLGNVVYKSLDQALAMPNSPFKACSAFLHIFNRMADQTGIPAIFLASFALQESSCNPNTVGGGGEQGLMQITKDKCGGAPNGDCREVNFNIATGARYFASRLDASGGNLIVAVAGYNGWRVGMSYDDATRARYTQCCTCQNNLDYLNQFFNFWIQGMDAYRADSKLYNNLAVCQ